MLDFELLDVSPEELDRLRRAYEPLTRAVRELIDATIRTEAGADTVAEVTAQIEAATARLSTKQMDRPFGVRYNSDGQSLAWGNVAIGLRNPIAPPLVTHRDDSGKVWADFHLGARLRGSARTRPRRHVRTGTGPCAR